MASNDNGGWDAGYVKPKHIQTPAIDSDLRIVGSVDIRLGVEKGMKLRREEFTTKG